MKPETKCGLLTGGGVCLWTLAEYLLGLHNERIAIGEYTGFFSALIPLTLLFILLKARRDTATGGLLTYGQGLKSGLHASLIGGLMVWAFMQVYNQFINPGWMDYALDWKVGQFRAQGMTEAAIREQIEFYQAMGSPIGCFLGIVAGAVLTGTVFSLLLTFILNRRRA